MNVPFTRGLNRFIVRAGSGLRRSGWGWAPALCPHPGYMIRWFREVNRKLRLSNNSRPKIDDHESALARQSRAYGRGGEGFRKKLATLDPQLGEWHERFVFGSVWARAGLSQEERMLLTIVALAAARRHELLKRHLIGALEAGVSARKIHEALIHLVVYLGWPATISALFVWQEVVTFARKAGLSLDIEYPLDVESARP